jgi:hypothetical protein
MATLRLRLIEEEMESAAGSFPDAGVDEPRLLPFPGGVRDVACGRGRFLGRRTLTECEAGPDAAGMAEGSLEKMRTTLEALRRFLDEDGPKAA